MACGPGCDCRCCAGIDAQTPVRLVNAPGLPAIAYRVGRHAQFMASLTARLSSTDYPALSALTTREPGDATLALFDALASSLDVLSFYTERYANEQYLRTATERVSVLEMARLIGYDLAPGVAAATHLAFTLQDLPGAPSDPITIPAGTRVQSVPGQDETAQVFETTAPAAARAAWNAVPVQTTVRWVPKSGDTGLWLAGVAAGLQPGDAILIVGHERKTAPASLMWQIRVLSQVTPDTDAGRTRIGWVDPLDANAPQIGVEVHAFRQRAALFGHNAPDPNMFGNVDALINSPAVIDSIASTGSLAPNVESGLSITAASWSWKGFQIGSDIDIDPANPKIVSGSWVALVSNVPGSGSADLPGVIQLYRAARVTQRSRQDFAIASKITRVTPEPGTGQNLAMYNLRATLVLAQSERLETAASPLVHPVQGDTLTLGRRVEGLVPGQPVALSGKRQPIRIAAGVTGLSLVPDEGAPVQLTEGDRLFMLEPAVLLFNFGFGGVFGFSSFASVLSAETLAALLGVSGFTLRLAVMDRSGRSGRLTATAAAMELATSEKEDATVREIAFIATGSDAVTIGRDHTVLALREAMGHVYERATLRLNANVAPATHGETVQAILGDGDGRQANQRFALTQTPLTHVSAATPSGRASTLEVRVNDVLWTERPTLYQAAPDARVYETFLTDDGVTTIQFGDAEEGARLPSGTTNVRARYRKGLGAAGNVAAGTITTLLSRPLGVSEAVNPSPATGGADGETLGRARENAPLTTLTLDRAVSIADYANLARAFAGIDKAHAIWIPSGVAQGVFLTIAGVDGALVPKTSETFGHLGAALATFGIPQVPIRIVNHVGSRIRITAALAIAASHESGKVRSAVEAALRAHFGFSARAFGQTVSVDEVAAVAHGVAGVEAVHVTRLYREGEAPTLSPRIVARLPVASPTTLPDPAELLTLSDAPIELDILP